MNYFVLIINGEKSVLEYRDCFSKIKEKISYYFYQNETLLLDIKKDSHASRTVKDKLEIINQTLGSGNRQINERLEFIYQEDKIFAYSHKNKMVNELYLSYGDYYLHTNIINLGHQHVLFFKYKYVMKTVLGFFRDPGEKGEERPFELSIIAMPLSCLHIVEDLPRTYLFNRQYRFLKEYPRFFNEQLNQVSSLMPYEVMFKLGLDYYEGFKSCRSLNIGQDYLKALILFKLCKDQLKNDHHPFVNNYFIECSLYMARCYEKLELYQEAVLSLKEGTTKEYGSNNICAYELANWCTKKRFRDYLNPNEQISYYEQAGSLATDDLGHLYFLKEDYQRAIEYYQKNTIAPYDQMIGYSYFMLEDYIEAECHLYAQDMVSDCSTISVVMQNLLYAQLFIKQEKQGVQLSIRLEADDVIYRLFDTKEILKKVSEWRWKKFFQSLFFRTVEMLMHDLCIDNDALIVLLAHCYRYGYYFPKNPETAFNLLKDAYESGSLTHVLLEELRDYYQEGIGVEKNPEEARAMQVLINETTEVVFEAPEQDEDI